MKFVNPFKALKLANEKIADLQEQVSSLQDKVSDLQENEQEIDLGAIERQIENAENKATDAEDEVSELETRVDELDGDLKELKTCVEDNKPEVDITEVTKAVVDEISYGDLAREITGSEELVDALKDNDEFMGALAKHLLKAMGNQ